MKIRGSLEVRCSSSYYADHVFLFIRHINKRKIEVKFLDRYPKYTFRRVEEQVQFSNWYDFYEHWHLGLPMTRIHAQGIIKSLLQNKVDIKYLK